MGRSFTGAVNVRTTRSAQKAVDDVFRRVRWFPGLSWATGRPTKEAMIGASWLWLATLDDATLEAVFQEYLPKLAAAMEADHAAKTRAQGGPPPPESRPGGSVPINPPKPPRRPKR